MLGTPIGVLINEIKVHLEIIKTKTMIIISKDNRRYQPPEVDFPL